MASILSLPQEPPTAEYLAYDKRPTLIAAVTAMMVLATTSVVLRFWLKQHRKVGLELDDWLIGASMLPMCGLIACAYIAMILDGVGKDFTTNIIEDEQRPRRTLQVSGQVH